MAAMEKSHHRPVMAELRPPVSPQTTLTAKVGAGGTATHAVVESMSRPLSCFSQIFDQQVQVVRVGRAWIKIEMLIEAPGLVVLGMNNDRADTGNLGSLKSSGKGIMQQGRSQSFPFGPVVDGEPGEQHHRNRVAGQTFHHSGGRLGVSNGSHCQAVIADDLFVSQRDIGLRAAGRLVVQGKTGNETIEIIMATVKILDQVSATKLLD